MMFTYERGMHQILSKNRILLVIPPLSNHLYHLYLWAIIKKVRESNIELTLIFNRGPIDNNRKYIEANKKTFRLEKQFRHFLIENGIPSLKILESNNLNITFPQDYDEFEGIKYAGDLLEINKNIPLLNLSLHSIFVSLVSSADEKYEVTSYLSYLKKLQDSFHYSFQLCKFLFDLQGFDEIIFLNGRDPGQAGVRYFAEQNTISWHALEHGINPGYTFHLETFQTQDRIAIQNRMKLAELDLTDVDEFEIEGWFQKWTDQQRKNKFYNPNLRTGNLPSSFTNNLRPLVPIFTTSLDEDVSSVGYSRVDLRSLILETERAADKIRDAGFHPLVVVHPNSLNKSWSDLRLLYTELCKYNLDVVWPWQNVSSYDLISISSFCLTWRSTIALEAILEGKVCMNLADSTYDLIVEIPRFSLENIQDFEISKYSLKAKHYLFFWMNHGHCVMNYMDLAEYNNLRNALFGRFERNQFRANIRYYFSILTAPFRWKTCTPKQIQRFFQLFGKPGLIDWTFRKILSQ